MGLPISFMNLSAPVRIKVMLTTTCVQVLDGTHVSYE